MATKYDADVHELGRRILEGPGHVDAATRKAAADDRCVPEPLSAYVAAVHRHAYEITDRDVEELRTAGYSEDVIFEITVAAAYGAAFARLDAGIAAVDETARRPRTGADDETA